MSKILTLSDLEDSEPSVSLPTTDSQINKKSSSKLDQKSTKVINEDSRIITLQDLKDKDSTIRSNLISSYQRIRTHYLAISRVRILDGHMQNLRNTALNVEFDKEVSQQAAQKNIEKIRNCTKRMHEQIDQQEKDIIAELPNLNPDQQTTVVEYWENVTTFLTSIFSYLKEMFNYVIVAIKKGLKIANDAFKQMFDEVKQWLEDVLNPGKN